MAFFSKTQSVAEYPAGTRVGNFELIRRMPSQGNMSEIYEARVLEGDHRTVALKFARDDESQGAIFQNLLRHEIELLSRLRHPGIVRVYPNSVAGKVWLAPLRAKNLDDPAPWYFTMEYLGGGTLKELLDSNTIGQYPLLWRIELFYQIAVLLSFIHSAQITHRDLKPANIMFRSAPRPDAPPPQPVLIDFGIAEKRQLRSRERVTAGTVAYADPEMVGKLMALGPGDYRPTKTNDNRPIDVWGMGVVAYELFTGKYPFGRTMRTEVLADRIQNREPRGMERGKIPAKLGAVMENMLTKSRDDRPTIDDVLYQLETQLDYLPPWVSIAG